MYPKSLLIFFTMFFFVQYNPVIAQTGNSATQGYRKELKIFMEKLKTVPLDPAILYPLTKHTESSIHGIYTSLDDNNHLRSLEREKAIRSLFFLLKEFNRNIEQGKLNVYDVPGTIQTYSAILFALLGRKPFTQFLEPISHQRGQIIAEALSQYKEFSLLDDLVVYKRVASSPDYILQFIENKPSFRFNDSLLMEAASHDPMKIVYYLNKPYGVQDRIRQHKNPYVQQLNQLSGDKHVSELLPFLKLIAENKLTAEEIIQSRTEVTKYFQLLVNTLQHSISEGETSSPFLKPLRSGIRQRAMIFYVNEINALHDSPDAKRFVSVNGLRPQDLYYIITSSGDELYTSSYLGLYKRLKSHFSPQGIDSLFDIVQYDNLRTFIRLAANYNVLGDFLHSMPPEKMKRVMQLFMSGIETDENTALERAMDIADSFTPAATDDEVSELIQFELNSGLNRSASRKHYLGLRLYNILSDVFSLVREKEGEGQVWSKLGDYKKLKREVLENGNEEVTEIVLFYGDEDGKSSFNNFLKLFGDKSKWELTKNANWVSIRSTSEKSLQIFANLPLEIEEEMDLKAQDSLFAYLEQQSIQPGVIVHRGHSYHLDKTLARLKPSMKLAILGSCGSYNKAISIANINPDVQVIGSKKTGAMSINDPILDVINATLVKDDELKWPEIWEKLTERFSKDPNVLELFNEYFPPSKNLSLFVLKLFRSNR